VRIALAQINTVVGDLAGNRDRIVARIAEARSAGADVVVLPELATTGYPPEDLLLRPGFLEAADAMLDEIAAAATGIVALVGAPHSDGVLYNACIVCAAGRVETVYRKRLLPNYGVFDEKRYFEPGGAAAVIRLSDAAIGLTVCEDLWQPGPAATESAAAGARLLVNLSASPFHVGKDREREEMFATRARDNGCWLVFCNSVGGQDELLFDGHSLVFDPSGRLVARAPGFEEALLLVEIDEGVAKNTIAPSLDDLDQMRLALCLGLRDYVMKNGFGDVVVGISGGVDSALTAALAVEALGRERVHCVSMPSRFSSSGTRTDAELVSSLLGVDFREIPIEPIVEELETALAPSFRGRPRDTTEENLQARVRGTLLMALSNKFGWLVLATGNKSEMSVGYATLYGDMAGGFALLKDAYKTDVWRLARRLNERSGRELIPSSIIERAPSAELAPGQSDQDSLPPYAQLDPVLLEYVEHDRSREDLVEAGFDPSVVARVVAMVDRAEYKRRQAAPGVKLRTKAFGRDRRTPITNAWRD
jgi:NAD+ synthase (glutamine-hydrolysing)